MVIMVNDWDIYAVKISEVPEGRLFCTRGKNDNVVVFIKDKDGYTGVAEFSNSGWQEAFMWMMETERGYEQKITKRTNRSNKK